MDVPNGLLSKFDVILPSVQLTVNTNIIIARKVLTTKKNLLSELFVLMKYSEINHLHFSYPVGSIFNVS